jgi:ankyrin repeat protein
MKIPRCATLLLVALAWSLASCGPKPSSHDDLKNNDEIFSATKMDDLEKVKALFKDDPDLVFGKDEDGRIPLLRASTAGRLDVVELLWAHGPTPMPRATKALRLCIRWGSHRTRTWRLCC